MDKKYLKTIGQELKVIRVEHNYRQDEVAKKTKIAPSTISSYENGNRDIGIKKLLYLLDFYKIRPDVFF